MQQGSPIVTQRIPGVTKKPNVTMMASCHKEAQLPQRSPVVTKKPKIRDILYLKALAKGLEKAVINFCCIIQGELGQAMAPVLMD